MTLPQAEAALAFYHELADQLRSAFAQPDRSTEIIRSAGHGPALTLDQITQLRHTADRSVWYAPRRAWALASILVALASGTDNQLLAAECSLTLAIALTALGDFVTALPLLQETTQRFDVLDRPDGFARGHSELAQIHAYRGEFDLAQTALDLARESIERADEPALAAYCDRAQGLIAHEQNRQAEALPVLQRAAETFMRCGLAGEASITWCFMANAQYLLAPQASLEWLARAKAISIPAADPAAIHAARCEFYTAQCYEALNRYAESLALYLHARSMFAEQGMEFYVAQCELYGGVEYFRLDRYAEALQAYTQARHSFVAQSLPSYTVQCDLNIGIIYYETSRYAEALVLYQRAAEGALAEGRLLRAARCYTNISLCCDRLGRYDQAIDASLRAIENCLAAGNPIQAAIAQENLARTYQHLGQYSTALDYYLRARAVFVEHRLPLELAWCDAYLAEIYEALNQFERALDCLHSARRSYLTLNIQVHAAACDRSIARVLLKTQQLENALEQITRARQVFVANELMIDVALCDSILGEIKLQQQHIAEARQYFESALTILEPSVPEEAWQARYGLGQCALAQGNRAQALIEWLAVVQTVNQLRAALSPERLSGEFFVDRQRLYRSTIQLALEAGSAEQALSAVEASKSQAYVGWNKSQIWDDLAEADSHVKALLDREAQLRQALANLRLHLQLDAADQDSWSKLRDSTIDRAAAMARLKNLSHEYESTIEQLRVAAPRRMDLRLPAAFSLQQVRESLTQHFGVHWLCLEYYLDEDNLLVFAFDHERVDLKPRHLSKFDRAVLDQCTQTHLDYRRLVYGAVGRQSASEESLRHLYSLLIPESVEHLESNSHLIIVPHGRLHALPFAALLTADTPLIDRVPISIAPSLSALRALSAGELSSKQLKNVLALGLAEFEDRAQPLPYALDELKAVREVFGSRARVLSGEQADRAALLRLQSNGALSEFNIIHFATHTILDQSAPSHSRILLHQSDLTYGDILNLKLDAHLAVLSSCESAIGQHFAGDEIMGLAQAFFFTGVRGVVASLWPVEDRAVVDLMRSFYQQLDQGADAAAALRAAQIDLRRSGYSMYQWAAWCTLGLP